MHVSKCDCPWFFLMYIEARDRLCVWSCRSERGECRKASLHESSFPLREFVLFRNKSYGTTNVFVHASDIVHSLVVETVWFSASRKNFEIMSAAFPPMMMQPPQALTAGTTSWGIDSHTNVHTLTPIPLPPSRW